MLETFFDKVRLGFNRIEMKKCLMKSYVLKEVKDWFDNSHSFLLLFAGLTYLLYLQAIFPQLVPHCGGGERFALNEANSFTFQIPWSAYTKLHLTFQANNTVKLCVNGDYVCDCTHYDLVIEQGEQALILLKTDSQASGMLKARQEIPSERQLLTLTFLLIGLICTGISIRTHRKKSIDRILQRFRLEFRKNLRIYVQFYFSSDLPLHTLALFLSAFALSEFPFLGSILFPRSIH